MHFEIEGSCSLRFFRKHLNGIKCSLCDGRSPISHLIMILLVALLVHRASEARNVREIGIRNELMHSLI